MGIEAIINSFGWITEATTHSVEETIIRLKETTYDLMIADVMIDGKSILDDGAFLLQIKCPVILINQELSSDKHKLSQILTASVLMTIPFPPIDLINNAYNLIKGQQNTSDKDNNHALPIQNNKGQKVFLALDEIQFIFAQGNYCMVNTQQGKYVKKTSLVKMVSLLNSQFIQISKFYVVNVDYIESVDIKKHIVMTKSETILNIGKRYREGVKLLDLHFIHK